MTTQPGPRILLVEDNPGDVFLVKEALRKYKIDHSLTIAGNGQAAWDLLNAAEHEPGSAFDLFLVDLNLPARPGVEIVARIRGSHTPMSHAPVIIVTSSDAERDRAAGRRAGADYYFRKPSQLGRYLELGSVVQDLLHLGGAPAANTGTPTADAGPK